MFSHFLVRDTSCVLGAEVECIDWPSGFLYGNGEAKPSRSALRAGLLVRPKGHGDVAVWGRLGGPGMRNSGVLEYDEGGEWRAGPPRGHPQLQGRRRRRHLRPAPARAAGGEPSHRRAADALNTPRVRCADAMSTQDIARSQTEPAEPETGPDLDDSALYFNRELSWVDFNDRVLQLAEDPAVPLLERVKFAAIYTSNLDEFFMVRVAGLQDQVDAGVTTTGHDGRTPSEVVDGIRERVSALSARLCRCVEGDLMPALAEHGIRIVPWEKIEDDERAALSERFRRQIFPVLTPLAVGLGRPFPYISNLSLSLAIRLRDPVTDTRTFARIKVPKEMLPRFVPVAEGATTFVPLEDVIAHHLDQLFPGMEILDYDTFRVTRDADFTVSDEADDLLQAVEAELRRRRFGEVVRVEVGGGMNAALREELTEALGVEEREVYDVSGLLDLNDLWQIVKLPGFSELRYEPVDPGHPAAPAGRGR